MRKMIDEYEFERECERVYLEERGADEVAINEEMCRVHNIPLYNNLPLCGEAEALRRLDPESLGNVYGQ